MKKSLLIMAVVLVLSCAKGKNESASSNVEENSSNSETVAEELQMAEEPKSGKTGEDSQKRLMKTATEFYATVNALFDDTDETYTFSLDNPEFSVFAFKIDTYSKEPYYIYYRYIFNKDRLLIFIQKIYESIDATWRDGCTEQISIRKEELITIRRGKKCTAVYENDTLSMLFFYENENNFHTMVLYERENKLINQFATKQDNRVYFGRDEELSERRLRITQNGDEILFENYLPDGNFKITKENEARVKYIEKPLEYIKRSDNFFEGVWLDEPDSMPASGTVIESRTKGYQLSVADIIIDYFYGSESDYPIVWGQLISGARNKLLDILF